MPKLEPAHILPNARNIELERAADKVATLLGQSTELTAALTNSIAIKTEETLSTIKVHFALLELDGLDSVIDTWPEVGTVEGYTGNKPFDLYKYQDPDGKNKMGSYWRNVAERHAIGTRILNERRMIADRNSVQNKYTGLDEGEIKARKSDLDREFATLYGKIREAVQLYFAMTLANDPDVGLGKVLTVDYARKLVLDDKGQPKMDEKGEAMTELDLSSPKVIKITDNVRNVSSYWSVPNFLRLSVLEAKKKSGTYADFIVSNARGPGKDEQPNDNPSGAKVDSPKRFEDATSVVLHYMNGIKREPASFRGVVGYYSEAGSDDRLMTLVNLRDQIDYLLSVKSLKERVDALTMTPSELKTKVAA